MTLAERLEAKTIPEPNSGCLLWIGARNSCQKYGSRYGVLRIEKNRRAGYGGRAVLAHRVAWEVAYGPIPEGMCVLHKCDNGFCVNPKHLFLGTQAENVADMHRKGRGVAPKGEAHPKHKLTEEAVRRIRELKDSGVKQTEIARMFNVDAATVNHITMRLSWRHI